jgi:hypothetical protein
MAIYEQVTRPKSPNVTVGLVLSAAVHAALVIGAVVLHKKSAPDAEPRFRNIVEAKLVRLGTPLPENALPRLVAAPAPPPPDPGVKLTRDDKATPDPPKPVKEPRRRQREPSAEDLLAAELKLRSAAAGSASARGAPGGRGKVGGAGPIEGDPRGDPSGEVSARDKVEGNLWAAEVRRELHRAWAIPEVIPDAILRTLAMTVIVQIDERGTIKSWKPRSSSQNALFNSSVKLVFNRVRSLPAPPAGALEMFKGGWLALRFTKEEAERSR